MIYCDIYDSMHAPRDGKMTRWISSSLWHLRFVRLYDIITLLKVICRFRQYAPVDLLWITFTNRSPVLLRDVWPLLEKPRSYLLCSQCEEIKFLASKKYNSNAYRCIANQPLFYLVAISQCQRLILCSVMDYIFFISFHWAVIVFTCICGKWEKASLSYFIFPCHQSFFDEFFQLKIRFTEGKYCVLVMEIRFVEKNKRIQAFLRFVCKQRTSSSGLSLSRLISFLVSEHSNADVHTMPQGYLVVAGEHVRLCTNSCKCWLHNNGMALLSLLLLCNFSIFWNCFGNHAYAPQTWRPNWLLFQLGFPYRFAMASAPRKAILWIRLDSTWVAFWALNWAEFVIVHSLSMMLVLKTLLFIWAHIILHVLYAIILTETRHKTFIISGSALYPLLLTVFLSGW